MIDRKAIEKNLGAVQARIAAATEKAGRDLAEVSLVVVTKGHLAETIQVLFDLGIRAIGESYAEEGRAKQLALSGYCGLKWHMIGHVQSRKADLIAQHFDMLHSADSLKLTRRLNRFAGEAGRVLPILLECNVSGEASKYGWPAADPALWPALFGEVEQGLALSNLKLQGLMTIAPIVKRPEQARPYFERARRLRDELANRFPQAELSQLSMGMSDDFEPAILEGATLVRIGTAILGPRPD